MVGDGAMRSTEGRRSIASASGRLRAMMAAYGPALRGHVARLGVPSPDVEDVVQEVFVTAALKLPRIDAGCERAFLFATAYRLAGNARRARRRRGRTLESLVALPEEPGPDPEDLTDHHAARALLDEALEAMPVDERTVFLLFEQSGLAIPEIARRLAVPEGTVATRLRRGREHLASWVARASAADDFQRARARSRRAVADDAREGAPEVVSWWVTDGEVDALKALVSVYERRHPHLSVVSATASGQTTARELLRSRMNHGKPPDTFQLNGGRDLASWATARGLRERMEPLDFLFTSEGLYDVFPQDILDMVTHRGRTYAVPLDIHRTNNLYYNTRIFDALGLAPPTTIAELYETVSALRRAGITPLALGVVHPWTLTMLAFEGVLVSEAGGEYYRDFFLGRRSPADRELRHTLEHVARLLGHANDDARNLRWDEAVDRVRLGTAAMTITGDWARGYLVNKGLCSGRDFGEVPMPGATDAFVFALDVFGLPKGAPHPAGAIELLKAIGSREGQDAFSPVKGSMPARLDADLARYDGLAQTRFHEFGVSSRFPSLSCLAPSCFTHVLETAMAKFATSLDADVVVDCVRAHYDLLTA